MRCATITSALYIRRGAQRHEALALDAGVGREAVQVMTPSPPHCEGLGVVALSD